MKHLLLSLTLILSANAWADMDDVCSFTFDVMEVQNLVGENCERNNILEIELVPLHLLAVTVSQYCRFDRQIIIFKGYTYAGAQEEPNFRELICVLYDDKPREHIKEGLLFK
ncbi:hypothetical protein OAP03_06935 [Gammaproteobacteria bacterium]|nr:hypothetical protein [Gammaproteobacteria bacterium]